ncbi:LysR family nitrogen assimilation transcriptional regulator [Beijerinckia sp. GAS462]|nr:LysR family nitrogen assimilation transcriptional regulator [Beijerinckia sp. GAS462]
MIDAGTMTAAAEALHLAQPALGAQIRQLEEELGVALILRHSRGVTATPAGKLLYERAQRILGEVEQAARDVRALNAQKQEHLRLGVNSSMVIMLGPDILMDAEKRLPDLAISLVEERTPVLLDALAHDQVDITFLYNIDDRPDLVRRALLEEDLLLVTAPDKQPASETVSFAEALRYDLAIGGERGILRHIVETEARRLSLNVNVAYEVHSMLTMKTMVARGTAATILPYSLVSKELRSGSLAARRIDRPALTWTLYVARRRNARSALDDAQVDAHIERLVEAMLERTKPWARRLT